MLGVAADTAEPFRPRDGHCRHIGVTHMTTKKPTALLALVGACALAATGPASLAAPTTPTPPQPTEQATASFLPVGDIDTALTSKSGQTPAAAPTQASFMDGLLVSPWNADEGPLLCRVSYETMTDGLNFA